MFVGGSGFYIWYFMHPGKLPKVDLARAQEEVDKIKAGGEMGYTKAYLLQYI